MKKYLAQFTTIIVSSIVVVGVVSAATTISTSISTGGALSVTGTSTLMGNVGVGTTTPGGALTIYGSSGNIYSTFYNSYTPNTVSAAFGTVNTPRLFYTNETGDVSGTFAANHFHMDNNLSSGNSSALLITANIPSTNLSTTGTMTGINLNVRNSSTATVSILQSINSSVNAANTGTYSNLFGIVSVVNTSAAGNITGSMISGRFDPRNGGGATVGSLIGLDVAPFFSNTGTITNTYGILIGTLTAGTQTNAAYSIYSSDPSARMYHAGNVGIGTTTPNSKLDTYGTTTVETGDLYIRNINYGVLMSDTVTGTCYRLRMTSGVLTPSATATSSCW